MNRDYYPNLDWVRVFLALEVVFIHSGIVEKILVSPVPAFLGVSGFVVYGSIQRLTLSQFFINRALRVLPLLFVSFLAVGFFFGVEAMFKNVIFWLWPFGDLPVNPVVWSLIYEEFYYAVLALMFVVGLNRFLWLPPLTALIFIYLVATWQFFDLPSPLFLLGGAFFLGNTFYIFRRTIAKVPSWVAVSVFCIVAAIAAQTPYTAIVRPEYALVDFASIGAVLLLGIAGPKLPHLKIDISYSLYLMHGIIVPIIAVYIPRGWTFFWVVLLMSLPICVACWYLIERPALKLKNLRATSPRAVPAE